MLARRGYPRVGNPYPSRRGFHLSFDALPPYRARDFKRWLNAFLRERAWIQAELARRSGLSSSQVSRLTNGVRRPLDACLRLARALGVSLDHVCAVAGLLSAPPVLDPQT